MLLEKNVMALDEAFSFVCTYRNWGFRGGAGGIRSESASSLQGRLLNGVGKSVHGVVSCFMVDF